MAGHGLYCAAIAFKVCLMCRRASMMAAARGATPSPRAFAKASWSCCTVVGNFAKARVAAPCRTARKRASLAAVMGA